MLSCSVSSSGWFCKKTSIILHFSHGQEKHGTHVWGRCRFPSRFTVAGATTTEIQYYTCSVATKIRSFHGQTTRRKISCSTSSNKFSTFFHDIVYHNYTTHTSDLKHLILKSEMMVALTMEHQSKKKRAVE